MINNSIATALLSFVSRIFNLILSYEGDNINLITYLNLGNLYLLVFNNFIGGKKRWDI